MQIQTSTDGRPAVPVRGGADSGVVVVGGDGRLSIARGIANYGETIAIEQGYGMGRPSQLNVEVRDGHVRLTGRCILSVEGQLRIK